MIKKFNIEEAEAILENSFNYDKIRRQAESFYYTANKLDGISTRCKIIFNPYRHIISLNSYDCGIEKYFDFEKYDDELDDLQAIKYKKIFVLTFIHLFSRKNELLK